MPILCHLSALPEGYTDVPTLEWLSYLRNSSLVINYRLLDAVRRLCYSGILNPDLYDAYVEEVPINLEEERFSRARFQEACDELFACDDFDLMDGAEQLSEADYFVLAHMFLSELQYEIMDQVPIEDDGDFEWEPPCVYEVSKAARFCRVGNERRIVCGFWEMRWD